MPTPERPSRYDRSFGGLLASMLVTVLFVAAYVGFRALTRDQPDIEPEVDYLSEVQELQAAEVTVVHPCGLPEGWRATSTSLRRAAPRPRGASAASPTTASSWGCARSRPTSTDLLASYVDESPDQGEDAAPTNHLGVSSWADLVGRGRRPRLLDRARPSPLAGQTLLVYGSASVAQQEQLIDLLTTAPVGGASAPC